MRITFLGFLIIVAVVAVVTGVLKESNDRQGNNPPERQGQL